MFIRKDVFKKVGGFNPEIIPAEEIEFANRAIKAFYKVYMDPETNLIHYARSNFKKFFKQIFRFGRSKINTIRRKAQPLKLIYLLPLISVVLGVALIIGSFFSAFIFKTLISLVGIYLAFDILIALISILENRESKNILLIFTVPIMHLAYPQPKE